MAERLQCLTKLETGPFTKEQLDILAMMEGLSFQHKWEIEAALSGLSDTFKYDPHNEEWSHHLDDFYHRLWTTLKN